MRNGDVIEPVHFFFMVQISPKDSECIVFRSKLLVEDFLFHDHFCLFVSSDNDQGAYPSFSMPYTPRIQIITSFTLIIPLSLCAGEGLFLGKIF